MNSLAQPGQAAPAKKPVPLQLRAAYGVCRHITRKAARNFYYAFLVLPSRKRDALSAVYAFMRHADDISDDLQLPFAEKRDRLQQWLEAMHRAIAGEPTDDPILLALAHSQARYKIPVELLEKLVYGTAMDVIQAEGRQPTADPAVLYRTFDELYNYCYHVASVVGLVCIKVFGYRDPAAEPLAEKCGIAFQLTNIIRDVQEDAAMGRIYLPQQDLDRFGLSTATFMQPSAAAFQPILAFEAERARLYYEDGSELIPLVGDDCQPALWCLIEIYRQLLEKIAARQYDVFSERVRLTAAEKLRIVAKGLWRRIIE
jgi:phytoene synthase